MTIKSQISKAIHFFNPLNLDNRGGLLIPINLKIRDEDYCKYRHLEMNPHINSLTCEDLPCEFSQKAVRLVDVFRRKTIDLDYEVMLIFDYVTSEIIYCFVNDFEEGDYVQGEVDEKIFNGKHIAVVHNHPIEYGSPPSDENFQILSLVFQDFEILSSWDGIWIIESKGVISESEILDIKNKIKQIYDYSSEISENMDLDEENIIFKTDEIYGKLLLEYISNHHLNIKLSKRELYYEN